MQNAYLKLLEDALKPIKKREIGQDVDLAEAAMEVVNQALIEKSLLPDDLLHYFKNNRNQFLNYLFVHYSDFNASGASIYKTLEPLLGEEAATVTHLRKWINNELIGLNAHFENFVGDEIFELHYSLKTIDVSQFELTLDLVTVNQNANSMTWDRQIFETKEPELLLMGLVDVNKHLLNIQFSRESRNPLKSIDHPLAHYYPERAKITKKFIKAGGFSAEDLMNGQLDITNEMKGLLEFLPLKGRINDNSGKISLLTRSELSMGHYHNQFVKKGSQIFDINKNLTTLFKETDVSDVPIAQVKTPYSCLYVHFGRQEDMPFTEGWHVDGAYVMHIPNQKVIQVMITCTPDNLEQCWSWAQEPEPSYFLTISGEQYDKTFSAALSESRDKKLSGLQDEIDNPIADKIMHVPDGRGGTRPVIAASSSHKRAAVEKQIMEAFNDVSEKALRLLVNSLCYIGSYPEKVDKVWPDIPMHVMARVRDKSKGKKKDAESALEKLGYRPIHFCGLNFVQEHPGLQAISETSVRQHWRRGHWRNQPFGEGRQQYRMRWIQPMLVNRDAESKPLGGIYLTD